MERKIYLENTPLEKAINMFFEKAEGYIKYRKTEKINSQDSLGRMTASPVFAHLSSPHFHAAAMDGIAVKAERTFKATELNPVRLKKCVDYVEVDTGNPLPEGFNAVIMIEDVVSVDNETVEIIQPAVPYQHVRPIGEDIVATELILPTNHKIRPWDLAALLAAGIDFLEVYKKVEVGIIPTGVELVPAGTVPEIGQIIEFNSHFFAALVKEWGGIPHSYDIVPDEYEVLKKTVEKALSENDFVIINAGSSAGRKDYTSKLISEMGELLIHGIATKPGKPAILGFIQNKPVIGVPGYPVSAYFVMDFFVKPLIAKLNFQQLAYAKKIEAVISRRVVSSLKSEDFIPVKLGKVKEKIVATPINKGAGVIMSLVQADGVMCIPQHIEGIEAGEKIKVELWKSLESIENTVVCIGSHDPLIDIIGDLLSSHYSLFSLSSAHVGSMGGIMALKRGECHAAGIHLLDAETGQYNIPYIKRYLKDNEVLLFHLVERIQGFLVQKGNPLNIKNFSDLIRPEVTFINRQKGSGTRLLLDYKLKESGIDSQKIIGYNREEFTHLAVAAEVKAGSAATGLGIMSAAKAMGLDFVPVCSEHYDIAILKEYMNLESVKAFIEIIRSREFKEKAEGLGGYNTEKAGILYYEG
ncbi:MAG: molybdopterin biosynthesis protein [Thermoanaerobacteraceae bacterium]|nr:molybdopterin biosynthesis protein [Thermoanaerobacteraceae bacterium]